eukprot:jgi/Ulvmu1/8975/UM005_0066.1
MSAEPSKVVAGVLHKYVNITKGWRDRLFVLADDKLVYFKLSGKHAVNVQQVLDYFDPIAADVTLIGAKILLLQKEHLQNNSGSATAPTPAASYQLKSAELRESGTESQKFYIRCRGSPPCTVKTETPDDRLAWMTALTHARVPRLGFGTIVDASSMSNGITSVLPTNGTTSEPAVAAIAQTVGDLQKHAETASDPASLRLVAALQKQVRQVAAVLEERDSQIRQLMDERRQLQTELVAESQHLDGLAGADLGTDRATSSSQDDDIEFDDDQSVVDSTHTSRPHPAAEHDGDFFYDAREPSKRTAQAAAALSTTVSAAETIPAKPAAATSTVTPAAKATPVHMDKGAAMSAQWLQDQPSIERRLMLPEPKEKQKSVSLWSIIKECIGKDLTRICLPVYFNEPLSALQRIAEEFEYSSVLDRAAASPKGSPERLLWMAVFAMTGYAGTYGRTCKPFNPLLGETFEFVDKKRNVRFLAEKVVHHPTVLAAHVEGLGWTGDVDLEVKSKFWGRCIELKPVAYIQLRFDDGEVMTWNKVTSTINNLILGKIYLEHSGTMRVQSNVHNKEVHVKFKDSGSMFGGSKRLVSGSMYEQNKEVPGYRLSGVWSEYLTNDSTSERLWEAAPAAPDPTRYNLSQFAIQLNEITSGLESSLPPTDCRLRPDQAALEQGLFDKANAEKQRLEKKQRKARKEAEEGVPIVSRWFQPVEGATRGEALAYKYTGGYWEQRRAGNFTDCRDIFGE